MHENFIHIKAGSKAATRSKTTAETPESFGSSRFGVWHVNRNSRVTPTRPRLSRPINYLFVPQKSPSRPSDRLPCETTPDSDVVTRVFPRRVSRTPLREGEVKILMWRLSQSAFYWRRVKGPQARKQIKLSLEFAATTANGMTLVFFILEFLVWSEGRG